MRALHVPIVIALCAVGCDGDSPAAPTAVVSDPGNTAPPVATSPGPSVARPSFKVLTYNVQLSNFGAPNPESRKHADREASGCPGDRPGGPRIRE